MVRRVAFAVDCKADVDAPVGSGSDVAEIGCVTPDPSTLSNPDRVSDNTFCVLVVYEGAAVVARAEIPMLPV